MNLIISDYATPFEFFAQNIPSKQSPPELDAIGCKRISNITIDVTKQDGCLMKRKFSNESVRKIWTALGQNVSNIETIECDLIPTYGCRIQLKLFEAIHRESISITSEFLMCDDIPKDNPFDYDFIDTSVFFVILK
jgi:hypothetical protein